ncbi:alpha/beta hydrolase, partial [Gammaproteobacteria bacterium]|nr:alpha/beta hydrolase [Gammaproteobacteria bacterium]
HGGGLTGGDKDNPISDLMYANIGTFFARNDMVGINATYRLVPNITYPQGGEDMQAIVAWIRSNASTYGINPEQIFFLCASAGCTHVSSLLFDQNLQFENDPDIAGAIMLSGAYGAGNVDYFGDDPAVRNARSALSLAENYTGEDVPVFLLSAEYDPNGIETGTAQLYGLLCAKRDACPRFAQARDHNHISINQHINTEDERYTSQMLEFIHEVIAD